MKGRVAGVFSAFARVFRVSVACTASNESHGLLPKTLGQNTSKRFRFSFFGGAHVDKIICYVTLFRNDSTFRIEIEQVAGQQEKAGEKIGKVAGAPRRKTDP